MNIDTIRNMCMNAPVLALKTGGSADMKTTNAINYKLNGYLYKKAIIATIDLPATFVVETGFQQGITVKLDSAGTVSFAEGETKANTEVYKFSDFDQEDVDECILGYLLVKNATGSQFVGNTTALDTASLTTTYIDNYGFIGA